MERVPDVKPTENAVPIPQQKLQKFIWARLAKARFELETALELERLRNQRAMDAGWAAGTLAAQIERVLAELSKVGLN